MRRTALVTAICTLTACAAGLPAKSPPETGSPGEPARPGDLGPGRRPGDLGSGRRPGDLDPGRGPGDLGPDQAVDASRVDAAVDRGLGRDGENRRCIPEKTQPCYTGPAGTRGRGQCKDGSQTCAADGRSWGACVGQVLPGTEDCIDGTDNDCNDVVDDTTSCRCPVNSDQPCKTPHALGAIVWYEAPDILGDGARVADGTAIARLYDKSGHGNHADLVGGTAAPLMTDHGHRALQLGGALYLTQSSLGNGLNTDIEVHFVARLREISGLNTVLHNVPAGDSNELIYRLHMTFFEKIFVDLPASDRLGDFGWGADMTEPYAWSMRASTTQGRSVARDGVPIATAGNKSGTGPLGRWYIGAEEGLRNPMRANLRTFIVFNRTLTASERSSLYQFLEARYGVAMSIVQ